MIAPIRNRPVDDDGLTLMELVIAAAVSAVVLAVIGTLFIVTLRADAGTRDRDLSTGRMQAFSSSLTMSARSASAVRVETVGSNGIVLRARIVTGASTSECRAWAIVDLETITDTSRATRPDGRFELRAYTYPSWTGTATAPAPTTSWAVLTPWVQPLTSGGSALPYFTAASPRFTWNIGVASAETPQLRSTASVVAITGTATALAQEEGTARNCW